MLKLVALEASAGTCACTTAADPSPVSWSCDSTGAMSAGKSGAGSQGMSNMYTPPSRRAEFVKGKYLSLYRSSYMLVGEGLMMKSGDNLNFTK